MTEPRTSQPSDVARRHAQLVNDESVDRPGRVPLTARLLLADSLTARRAAGIIAVHSVYPLLIFGAFMSPSVAEEDTSTRGNVRAVFGLLLGARRHV